MALRVLDVDEVETARLASFAARKIEDTRGFAKLTPAEKLALAERTRKAEDFVLVPVLGTIS